MPAWFVDFGRYASIVVVWMLVGAFVSVAAAPAWWTYDALSWLDYAPRHELVGYMLTSLRMFAAYVVWGLSMCVLHVVIKRFVFLYRAKEGGFAVFSFSVIGWSLTSVIHRVVSFTFLWLLLGTPLINWYFRGLGARIGRRVNINTTTLWDWDMLTLHDDCVLGGESVVQGHLLEGGKVKMAPVVIGTKALVGSRASVMPGCVLGERALLAAGGVLKKHEQVPANAIYGGVPAKLVRMRSDVDDSGIAKADTAAPGPS
jgi:acetyltransferase-like isoleucine patch superfamily enzyme